MIRKKIKQGLANGERYFFGDLVASGLAEGEAAGEGVVDITGATDGEGDACGDDDEPDPGFSTERDPVIAGCESINATSMNEIAAPIVIFARMLAVPRGPNAVLETLLLNIAPASDLPGCKSTTTTSTTQARIKMPYKR
jgi:hypothetical protein